MKKNQSDNKYWKINYNVRGNKVIGKKKIINNSIQKTDYNLGAESPFGYATNRVSDQDAENYDNVRDLFWWYCKMDVYQSMLGGTKLL